MRAHAATQFTLNRFGAWRWAVFLLCGVLALLAGAWVGAAGSPAEGWDRPVVAAGLTLLGAWLVALQARPRPVTLAWDGERWHLGEPHGAAAAPARSGDLRVTLDLGAWMLLRFTADASPVYRRVRWIPAQRAGHAAQWHALRCAVYSPRPDAGADAAPDV